MAENTRDRHTSMETPSKNKDDVNINTYRKLVRSYINQHQYTAAEFWADKVVSLSDGEAEDVYWLAQCMFLMKQYHRAAHLIRSRGLERQHIRCHYLAAKSLLEAKEPAEALLVLEKNELEVGLNDSAASYEFNTDHSNSDSISKPANTSRIGGLVEGPANMHSAVLFLKGQVYEAMDNRGLAADCYKQALFHDVHCYEAFDSLVQHHMLTAWEEQELLESLPISKECTPAEERFLRFLYKSKLKKYDSPNQLANEIEGFPSLSTNLDLAVSQAEKHYYNCNYTQCTQITSSILKKDPYHRGCLPVHISCLVELQKYNDLFYLGHKLVDLYPEIAISWFAVGCYYYTIGKSDPARRYLAKATAVDRLFGPAWLAYGHSFAAENEHDQAMAAYFKASQLMKGCHLPLLYIGLECGLTNNVKLADKFFMQAKSIAPDDPFVLHEMGVIAFQNLEFETARRHFTEALDRVRAIDEKMIADKWEPLLNNLGHTCRKLGLLEEALEYHRQALLLSPLNPSTYSAMGFIYALLCKNAEAVEAFHKALGIRRDDTFSTTMLNQVIQELMEETPPFDGAPDKVPTLFMPSTSGLQITYPDATEEENPREQIMLDVSGSSSGASTVEVEMQEQQDSSRVMIESD